MERARITVVPAQSYFSKGLKQQLEHINGRIRALFDDQLALDQRIQSENAAGLEALDFPTAIHCPDAKAEQARLLQTDLNLRRELVPLFGEIQCERAKQIDVVHRRYEKVQEEIHEALLGIGFVEKVNYERRIGQIEPGWILSHPRAHKSRERLQSLRNRQGYNFAAIQKLEALDAEHLTGH